MKKKFYVGKVFDVGHAATQITRCFENSPLGVEIIPQDSAIMTPRECRLLGTYLLEVADWCEQKNEPNRRRKKSLE
jgi:hypothetical protein